MSKSLALVGCSCSVVGSGVTVGEAVGPDMRLSTIFVDVHVVGVVAGVSFTRYASPDADDHSNCAGALFWKGTVKVLNAYMVCRSVTLFRVANASLISALNMPTISPHSGTQMPVLLLPHDMPP